MRNGNRLNSRKVILIADDDPDDRLMIKDAFNEHKNPPELLFVEDGEELMRYLTRKDKYAENEDYPFPQVVILDLNMPRMDGRQALREIKSDPKLKHIPVVVLSTSNVIEDIVKCYEDGSNSFLTKPPTYDELVELTKSFNKYWIETAVLPPPRL